MSELLQLLILVCLNGNPRDKILVHAIISERTFPRGVAYHSCPQIIMSNITANELIYPTKNIWQNLNCLKLNNYYAARYKPKMLKHMLFKIKL